MEGGILGTAREPNLASVPAGPLINILMIIKRGVADSPIVTKKAEPPLTRLSTQSPPLPIKEKLSKKTRGAEQRKLGD